MISLISSAELVIIPCGGAKADKPCTAGEMYVGGYHKACQTYALALVKGDRDKVLILSAKYGLLELDDPIEPYELRMGTLGCVTSVKVYEQARDKSLLEVQTVVALGGRDYTSVVKKVWPHALTPLEGVGGIGKQLAWLVERTKVLQGRGVQISTSDRKCSKCGKPTPEREMIEYHNRCEDCAIASSGVYYGAEAMRRVIPVEVPPT